MSSAFTNREALALSSAALRRDGRADTLVARLADRLARADGSLAQARELRAAVAVDRAEVASALRRAAAWSRLLPPLGVALARQELRRRLPVSAADGEWTELSVGLSASPGRRAALIITASADYALAARSAADFRAAGFALTIILVGAAATDADLGRRLRDLGVDSGFKVAADASAAADHLAAGPAEPDHVSLHALDRAEASAFLARTLAPTVDINIRPSDPLGPPSPPVDALPRHWDLESLARAVVLREQPACAETAAGGVIRRWVRTPAETGRALLRLAADVPLPEAHRALDCLVAMSHVWIVSVDPSLDPYLIERVAHDAAFCEVQTEDVLADFLRPGDRLRVVGSLGPEAARATTPGRVFSGPVTEDPWAELAPYYLPQTIRVARRGLLDARALADTACSPPPRPAH